MNRDYNEDCQQDNTLQPSNIQMQPMNPMMNNLMQNNMPMMQYNMNPIGNPYMSPASESLAQMTEMLNWNGMLLDQVYTQGDNLIRRITELYNLGKTLFLAFRNREKIKIQNVHELSPIERQQQYDLSLRRLKVLTILSSIWILIFGSSIKRSLLPRISNAFRKLLLKLNSI